MESTELYDINELVIKFKSKKELYYVMINDCDVYLPPIQFANAPNMRGVVSGKIWVS